MTTDTTSGERNWNDDTNNNTVTEIQKICMLGSARILQKVLSV